MISLLELVEKVRLGRDNGKPTPTHRPDAVNQADVDAAGLAAALAEAVRGDVLFDDGSRAVYSTDASNYRQIPIGVVVPRDAADVVTTIEIARRFGAPILSRGGGTSLAGETCNAAVVLDMSKYMNAVIDIDWERRIARVQPGTVLDDLRDRAETRHLTFGPDPATHNRNTLGGMIGNNSCGMHAQMAGKVEENVEELDILTYDGVRMRVGPTSERELEAIVAEGGRRGEIYAGMKALRDKYGDLIRQRYPKIPRLVSGFPLQQLLPENGFNVARALVGTESTCVTVLEATLRLVASPPHRTLLVLGFDDIFLAGDCVAFCNTHTPIALEGIDTSMFTYMHDKGMATSGRAMFPDGNAWLIVEFGGETKQDADDLADALMRALAARTVIPSMKRFDVASEEKQLWEIRESGLGATSKVPHEPDFYPGWEDSAVAPEDVGDYLRDLTKLMDAHGYKASMYGHFGQGCIHCSIDFDLFTAPGIENWKRFLDSAAHLVTGYGGSLSGEHGDGQARGSLLPIMFGDELVEAFREFKRLWDPLGKMNPGKVVDAFPVDANLRWGKHYEPWEPKTHFSFLDDNGSFAHAANRCIGTGKCRKHDSGVMCPSYMVTRDEKDSTRGRARLLFEMLEGDPLTEGWQDESVKDALDLCLACKGCKGECPVNVDMATYKAEFLAHYYEGHRRPVTAYAFGLIMYWAHLASFAPWLVNAVTQTPVLRDVAKLLAGMAPQRTIPPFARKPFKTTFAARTPKHPAGPPVILWADTFNNYFHAATAEAAVDVLEAAGYRVIVPQATLCCGRPLYDYGMLDLAKTFLRQILAELQPHIEAGVCVVGLEPSCMSVFKDELVNMLPGDRDAQRLRDQTYLLGEFLARKTDYVPPRLERKAVVHGHCHQKSVLGMDGERELLERLGLDFEILDSGCCGMAGAFGFEAGEHYQVSMKAGERALLPKVRAALPQTLLISDGFSCREQISQTTGRHALHIAQVLKMAIDEGPGGPAGAWPESAYVTPPPRDATPAVLAAAAVGLAIAGYALARALRSR